VDIVDENIGFGKVEKWSTRDCKITAEGKQLTIFYTPITTRSFYNVADHFGKVIATGSVSETGITACVLPVSLAGNYFLNLVDGEDMLTHPFLLK
jgi:hypothetical protein